MEDSLKQEEVHRQFHQKRAQQIFETGDGPDEEECPCSQCVGLSKPTEAVTTRDRALEISTKMTYDQTGVDGKHLISHKERSHDSLVWTYEDNFIKGGWT